MYQLQGQKDMEIELKHLLLKHICAAIQTRTYYYKPCLIEKIHQNIKIAVLL